ncbi:MAG: metallophosphoesterase [Acidimicrobiia bacterium]|nr:metallophosphoesterase [Acidimicrobiia bacterium]
MRRDSFLIVQLSDLHCGSPYFDPELLACAVGEVRAADPDLVLVGGDLTAEGYAGEFRTARRHLEPILDAGFPTVVIPGNHDAKNVGYLHFRDAFGIGDVEGKADTVLTLTSDRGPAAPARVTVVALDSTKPDLAEGEIGRERYAWIRRQFAGEADLRLLALHHHLVPVPGTGRERNTIWDAGDVLALLDELDVHIVLSGHKHVPFVWLLNGVLIVNSGTVSSYRLRGYTRPSYNLVEVTRDRVRVTFRYPGAGERSAGELDVPTMQLRTNPELAGMFTKSTWNP